MKTNNIFLAILGTFLILSSCKKDEDDQPTTLVNFNKTFQPDSTDGQDAFIYTANTSGNFATHPDFMTFKGGSTTRSLIRFDFSSIPSSAIVDSVKLSLYSYQSPSNGNHNVSSGSQSVLRKLDSTWTESTVTWDNQPTSSDLDQVILDIPQSTIQDYLDIDVTDMAKGMINTPSSNHGFIFQLEDELSGGKMVFASSDNSDSNLHPKIVVYYSVYQ